MVQELFNNLYIDNLVEKNMYKNQTETFKESKGKEPACDEMN